MENENKAEAPLQDTPPAPKSFVDSIMEIQEANSKEEEVTTESGKDAPEAAKAEVKEDSKLQETLNSLLKEEEGEVDKLKGLLPNTKDESKKLEIERAIFEKEKRIEKLKGSVAPEVIDLSDANAILEELKISKEGESYKLIEKMKGMPKGGSDLIKMFTRIAKAIAADSKKIETPIAVNDKPKDSSEAQPKEDNSIVGQIARSLKK